VPKPYFLQYFYFAKKIRDVLKKINGFIYSHFQNIADRFSFVPYLKSFAVVSFSVAFFTFYINVRKKIHFYYAHSASLANIASPTFDIKRKTAWFITSYFSFRNSSKKCSYIRKKTAVSSWVTSWSPANRRLVYFNYFINIYQPFNTLIRKWYHFTFISMKT